MSNVKLLFLDLETTGLEANAKICSIAIIVVDGKDNNSCYELVDEKRKIPASASMIHGITNEMIKGKKTFLESDAFLLLQKYNQKDSYIVAHNAAFDLKILSSAGVAWEGGVIDTMRCAKHLFGESDSFALGFLRYDLKLYRHEKDEALKYFPNPDSQNYESLCPHNARFDAVITKMLFDVFLEMRSFEELLVLNNKNALMQKLFFGKYSGRYIEEVAMQDRSYLEWMISNIEDIDDDLRYSISTSLKGAVK